MECSQKGLRTGHSAGCRLFPEHLIQSPLLLFDFWIVRYHLIRILAINFCILLLLWLNKPHMRLKCVEMLLSFSCPSKLSNLQAFPIFSWSWNSSAISVEKSWYYSVNMKHVKERTNEEVAFPTLIRRFFEAMLFRRHCFNFDAEYFLRVRIITTLELEWRWEISVEVSNRGV